MSSTPIIDLVELLLSANCPPDEIVKKGRVLEKSLAENARASALSARTADKRRAWDRDYRRRRRSESGGRVGRHENEALESSITTIDSLSNRKKEKNVVSGGQKPDDGWPDDCFDQFWAIYPKKVHKPTAQKRLLKVRQSGVSFTTVMSGLTAYVRAIKFTDRQYIKGPDVWLNKGCWDDEYPAQPVQRAGSGRNGVVTLEDLAVEQMNGRRSQEPDDGFLDLRADSSGSHVRRGG